MGKSIALAMGLTMSFASVISGQTGRYSYVVNNVDKALMHLYESMDRYHKTTDVYTEQDAGGNIYFPALMPDGSAPLINRGDCLENPKSGLTCTKIEFIPNVNYSWAGIYWLYPEQNWGVKGKTTLDTIGYDLRGATKLTFWARGQTGTEQVRFFLAGIRNGKYQDPVQKSTRWETLSTSWNMYTISLQGMTLNSIIGGFGFVVDTAHNSNRSNITFYLDDIQYDKPRLDTPRVLLSYDPSLFSADYPEDFASRNAAYTNDNALVMMTFMRDTTNRQNEDWVRAKLIGDAFLISQNSDRYFQDGRLRNGPMTGDLTYLGKLRLSGWYDYQQQKWLENEYAVSSYTGSMVWVMIAWLWYDTFKDNPPYVESAIRLGEWVHSQTYDTRGAGGYTRGFWGPDSAQKKFLSKSTEDNILLYSAFKMLFRATGDQKWMERALHARDFVIAMWNSRDGHFWPGTVDDGVTLLRDVIPLNIHTLAYMVFQPDPVLRDKFAPGIDWVYDNLRVEICNFKGFDFNDDRDGVWFDGTAQMTLTYKLLNHMDKANNFLEQLRAAQDSARNGNGKGIVEACQDSLSTQFYDPRNNPVYKNNRLHIGATAWYICAETGFKPTKVELKTEDRVPESFFLFQNHPNPFKAVTTIRYQLPKVSEVNLAVYNILGQSVRTLAKERQYAGYYSVNWDGKDASNRNVPNGMYFYRIIADNFVKTGKMLILR